MAHPNLIRISQVTERTGTGVRTIWRWVKEDKTFPQPYRLSDQFIVWDAAEIDAWIASKKGVRGDVTPRSARVTKVNNKK